MAEGSARRQFKRRGTNRRSRRIALPFSTRLWRQVARRILENDTDQDLDDESEDMSLELMVVTAPFSQIRANPMAWALFMRGYEVGRHFMQMTAGDLQQNHEQDLSAFQSAAPCQNQLMLEESASPVVREVERGPAMQVVEAADIPAEIMVEKGSVEELMTLSINDSLSQWPEEILSLVEEPRSTSPEVEQAHVLLANEDLTLTDYDFLLDDDDLLDL